MFWKQGEIQFNSNSILMDLGAWEFFLVIFKAPKSFPSFHGVSSTRSLWNLCWLLLTENLFFRFSDESGAAIEKPMATLVYIHGESYEWNSGNLYDGTVLAAHSKIIVVTINFRLGVLGELSIMVSYWFETQMTVTLNTSIFKGKTHLCCCYLLINWEIFYGTRIYDSQIIREREITEIMWNIQSWEMLFYGFTSSFMAFWGKFSRQLSRIYRKILLN